MFVIERITGNNVWRRVAKTPAFKYGPAAANWVRFNNVRGVTRIRFYAEVTA